MENRQSGPYRWVWLIAVLSIFVLGSWVYSRAEYVVPVLMYHAVEGCDTKTRWHQRGGMFNWKWGITPETFARQVEFLVHDNYSIVSLDALARQIEQGKPIDSKTVVITFDDGFASAYHNAFPVLKRWGVQATFFITTSLVGTPGHLTWEQVREMHAAGMTIGSHTMTHPSLPRVDDAVLWQELFASKIELERRLGQPVLHFAYPGGAYDDHAQQLVHKAGYRTASATPPHQYSPRKPADSLYAIQRINISCKSRSSNLLIFRIQVSGYYTWLKEKSERFFELVRDRL